MTQSEQLVVGGVYVHFKGNHYRVIAASVKGATDPSTLFVVYESLKDGTQWMREQDEFLGYHENGCKRFSLVEISCAY